MPGIDLTFDIMVDALIMLGGFTAVVLLATWVIHSEDA